MKKFWLSKVDCTGCGMCANVCPKNAISIEEDSCGFYYPVISNNCINCDACEKACRKRIDVHRDNYPKPITYATWSQDKDIRFKSTSGGAFSELVLPVLNSNGYVVGAEYDTDNTVKHCVIHNTDDLNRIRQSKYVQSWSGDIYSQVKKLLKDNTCVVFCGTPCQIAALYAYLGKEYDNLYTIDFVCRGVNSPKAYRAWLSEIEVDNNTRINKVWFKYKVNGWKASPLCTRLDFENGEYVVLNGRENLFMDGYLTSNLYIRPSCANCHFKGVPRLSDITLADFWGIEAELDDDKGTSMLLINSRKGQELFDKVVITLSSTPKTFETACQGNVCLSSSVVIDNLRNKQFLESLDKMKFSKAFDKFQSGRPTIGQWIKRKLKQYWGQK